MADGDNEDLVEWVLGLQQQFATSLNDFKSGRFPDRYNIWFEGLYKQAILLLGAEFDVFMNEHINFLAQPPFEQFDILSDQMMNGEDDENSLMAIWVSLFNHRHVHSLPNTITWSQYFAFYCLSSLVQAKGGSATGPDIFGESCTDAQLTELYDLHAYQAIQTITLAQICRQEEINSSEELDEQERKFTEKKSRENKRAINQRWAPATLETIAFDDYYDENSKVPKIQQARSFIRSRAGDTKPSIDELNKLAKNLVKRFNRYNKKMDLIFSAND